MRRLTETKRPETLESLKESIPRLKTEPQADCSRYDTLRSLQREH